MSIGSIDPVAREHAMARVTVEDCLEREENRFALVVLAARRARQLMKGAPPLVHSKNKAAVSAPRVRRRPAPSKASPPRIAAGNR